MRLVQTLTKQWTEKIYIFHKHRNRDDIPLNLPHLFVNKKEINRASSIKFLGVIFGKNLNWNEHLNTIENKVSKSIGNSL